MKNLAMYLAGSIQKGHEKGTYWTLDDMNFLRNQLEDFTVTFLNPAIRSDDLSDSYSVY